MRFMQTSKLFTLLPEELVCTPDGMAIDRDGNLILSCPNFAGFVHAQLRAENRQGPQHQEVV